MILAALLLGSTLFFLSIAIWNALAWPMIEPGAASQSGSFQSGSISALIPARNEEANIEACLQSVINQGEAVGEILVCDDHSEDKTAQIVREQSARDSRVRLITSAELPPGWCGKNFACAQLANEARGEWLLFLDADARLLNKGAAAAIVEEAARRRLTMLSCWPRLGLESFWEKVLMPMLNFVVFTIYPAPLALVRNDPALGIAHGACILARRLTYFAVGGHSAVRGEVFEDTRLASLWRMRGERGLCLDGQRVVSVRMYRSFAEISSGFQKNFFPAFRRESNFWAFLLLHAVVFLAPFILLGWTRAWPALAAAACVVVMRALLAFRFGQPVWSALLHPLAEIVLIFVGLASRRRLKSGKGVEWKGRRLLSQ